MRLRKRERKKEEKEAKAREFVASWALQQQQRNAVTLLKSFNTYNKGKRITLYSADKILLKRC